MDKSKVLMSFVPVIYIIFIACLLFGQGAMAYNVSSLISPAIAICYFLFVKEKTLPVSLFLIFFSVSDAMVLFDGFMSYKVNYFIGNSLYVLAYASLLFEICKRTCVKHIYKDLKVHAIVLIALNAYIVYVLQVDIVSVNINANSGEYFMELTYNIVMLLLLSLSLLNYFHRDDKKSLLLFLGSLCIVFAEVIGVAYLYITSEALLSFLSTTLYLLALYFYYSQSKVKEEKSKKLILEEL